MKSLKGGDLETTLEDIYEKEDKKENKMVLKNEFVYVRIDDDGIFAKDLTDIYNEESFFTQSKRNLKTAIKEIVKGFCPTYKFKNVRNHVLLYDIKIHQYCAMD